MSDRSYKPIPLSSCSSSNEKDQSDLLPLTTTTTVPPDPGSDPVIPSDPSRKETIVITLIIVFILLVFAFITIFLVIPEAKSKAAAKEMERMANERVPMILQGILDELKLMRKSAERGGDGDL